MKWAKRAAGIGTGIFIFVAIVHVLNYMYVACDDEWERILWHSFYEEQGKIDNLYLGSSHVYCDIDPYQLDQLNGQYNFNLATSGQPMNGTYYLLKEADQRNELSHVYVETGYLTNVILDEDDGEPMETRVAYNWKNTDHMRFSPNKLQYMITMANSERYSDIFLGFSRYRSHLADWEYVRRITDTKKSREHMNYQYHSEWDDGIAYDEYLPRGCYYSTGKIRDKERLFGQEIVLGENPMAETSEAYLRKVISYCQEREIPLTLFISPIYELQLISTEHYDNYLEQVRGIAAEYHVDIYDFNLVGEEYLPIQKTRYFRDAGHLNATGAELFTEFFHKIMSGDAEENRKYFYDTYAQKLAHAEPEVYGLCYHVEETGKDGATPSKSIFIASNRDEGMEYRVIMTPGNDRDQYLIQDFSENKTFKLDSNEHGKCAITYRMKNTSDAEKTIEITY